MPIFKLSSEMHYVIRTPEFGEHKGKKALIRCALYSGTSAERD